MNNIDNFIKTLVYQKYSKGSIHNYKSDIAQFMTWADAQDNTDSLREKRDVYEKVIKRNYKKSTVKRKMSSINAYIDYVDPITTNNKNIVQPSSFIKQQRSALFLGGYSIALLSLSVLLITASNKDIEIVNQTEDVNIRDKNVQVSSEITPIKSTDVKVAVSAPGVDTPFYYDAKDEIENIGLTNKEVVSGRASISFEEMSHTIYSPSIKPTSTIHITLNSSLNEGNIYVEAQGDGWVKVSLSKPSNQNINFSWFILDTLLDVNIL